MVTDSRCTIAGGSIDQAERKVVLNAANEVAVEAFLAQISFTIWPR